MKKLSKTQQEVYDQMIVGVWYSAYDLHAKLSTLFVLYNRGYIQKSPYQFGDGFFPRINITFCRRVRMT